LLSELKRVKLLYPIREFDDNVTLSPHPLTGRLARIRVSRPESQLYEGGRGTAPDAGRHQLQIRELEQELSVLLFHREGREIRLSEEARLVLPALQRAFADISQGSRRDSAGFAGAAGRHRSQHVFAAHWLLRRLARFWRLHPQIKLRLQHPAIITGPDVHLAIQWHKAPWQDPRMAASLLFLSDLSPVCSPDLISEDRPLDTPKDLLRHILLRDEITREAWADWFCEAGLDERGAALR